MPNKRAALNLQEPREWRVQATNKTFCKPVAKSVRLEFHLNRTEYFSRFPSIRLFVIHVTWNGVPTIRALVEMYTNNTVGKRFYTTRLLCEQVVIIMIIIIINIVIMITAETGIHTDHSEQIFVEDYERSFTFVQLIMISPGRKYTTRTVLAFSNENESERIYRMYERETTVYLVYIYVYMCICIIS